MTAEASGSMEAPPYVEQGGLSTAPPPLRCEGVRMYGFWVGADWSKLARRLQATFEEASDGSVVLVPWLPAALIAFIEIERVIAEPFAHKGYVEEVETAVWVPAMSFRRVRLPWPLSALPVPRPLRPLLLRPYRATALATPFMWLDNPISISGGRELYGYPKNYGEMRGFPKVEEGEEASLPSPSATLELDIFGIDEFDPDSVAGMHHLLSVQRVDPGAGGGEQVGEATSADGEASSASADPPQELGPFARSMVERLLREARQPAGEGTRPDLPAAEAGLVRMPGERAARWRWVVPILARLGVRLVRFVPRRLIEEQLAAATVNQIFLKQFRTAKSTPRLGAAYQEVVDARATSIDRFEARMLEEEYRLDYRELDSHDLFEELGLRRGPIALAYAARFSFTVREGRTLWRRAVRAIRSPEPE